MKTIFKTERLQIRALEANDTNLFFEMMSDPRVMDPIPQKTFSRDQSDSKLTDLIEKASGSDTRIWCVTEKGKDKLIGICGFLKNDANEEELAYRFMEKYWGKGLGTEIASALIDYGFNVFKAAKITADVYVMNSKSEKILIKFMSPVKEFYNAKDNCTDRRYEVRREIWLQKQIELKQ